MKKIVLFAITLALFSCSKEVPEYTIISGKLIENAEPNFTLRGIAFEKEINLKDDGSFIDTLDISYNGAYRIGRQEIYLHQGKSLTIEVDIKDWATAKFGGDLQAENNYITQKQALDKEHMGTDLKTYFLVEEPEFLSKINELEAKRMELIEKSTFSILDFKEKELRSLDYQKNSLLNNYVDYQKFYGENPDFTTSENFPKFDDTINLENEEEYYFSSAYRGLVRINFFKNVDEEVGEDQSPAKYFQAIFNNFKKIKTNSIKNDYAKIAAQGISASSENSEEIYNYIMANVTDEALKEELTTKFNNIKKLVKGNPSPKFNYENHKSGTTSLDDFKGKYVYVDVWATWCGPCKREIPFLKEIEKKYHGKNIEIVSISIDDKKDYDTWKNFVTDQQLGGVQLYADKAWESDFVKNYAIDGIPRFIFIDTEGNIISADAPRPSDEKLIELFNEYGI